MFINKCFQSNLQVQHLLLDQHQYTYKFRDGARLNLNYPFSNLEEDGVQTVLASFALTNSKGYANMMVYYGTKSQLENFMASSKIHYKQFFGSSKKKIDPSKMLVFHSDVKAQIDGHPANLSIREIGYSNKDFNEWITILARNGRQFLKCQIIIDSKPPFSAESLRKIGDDLTHQAIAGWHWAPSKK